MRNSRQPSSSKLRATPILASASWIALGRGIQATTAMFLPLILVRALTQTDYGLFKQMSLAGTLLWPFLVLGFDKSVTNFLPRHENDLNREVSTPILSVLTLSITALLLALLFPGFFVTIFGIKQIPLLVMAATMYGISYAFSLLAARTLVAIGSPRIVGLLPAVIGIPRTVTLVALALFFQSVQHVLYGAILFALLEILVTLMVLRAKGCLKFSFDTSVFQRHIKFGGTLGILAAVETWAKRVDRYLVSTTLSPGIFATYVIGRAQVPLLKVLTPALSDATAPRYSLLESEGRHRDMAMLWRNSAEALLPLHILFTGFLVSTAPWLIPVVFTEVFRDSVPIFQVSSLSVLIEPLLRDDLVLRALAALRFLSITVLLSLIVRTVLGLAALKIGSLVLLVGSHILVEVYFLFVRLNYIHRQLQVSWSDLLPYRGLGFPLVATIAGALLTFLISRWMSSPVPFLFVTCSLWGMLGLAVTWRQKLWPKLLPFQKQ